MSTYPPKVDQLVSNTITIGANGVVKIDNRFFLIIEIKTNVPGVNIDPLIVIRITEDQANALVRCGIRTCQLADSEPEPKPPSVTGSVVHVYPSPR